jgi:hypothetical protein
MATTKPAEGAAPLMGLFSPPLVLAGSDAQETESDRKKETPTSNENDESTPLLRDETNDALAGVPDGASTLMDMFQQQPIGTAVQGNKLYNSIQDRRSTRKAGNLSGNERAALLKSLKDEQSPSARSFGLPKSDYESQPSAKNWVRSFAKNVLKPTTFAGAFMFLLYHVVFCLTMGSAIIRPRSSRPILGIMAKMSATGIFFASPLYVYRLGLDIPAIYPSIDLFLAPFLASAARVIDDSLFEEKSISGNDDRVFFASFAVLASIGMFLSGIFLLFAATFKLANLGTFLPYSVLCGFFSSVGILLWALAFSVDTNGKTWQKVFFSGDSTLIWDSCAHHAPSLAVGILMHLLGPKQ